MPKIIILNILHFIANLSLHSVGGGGAPHSQVMGRRMRPAAPPLVTPLEGAYFTVKIGQK